MPFSPLCFGVSRLNLNFGKKRYPYYLGVTGEPRHTAHTGVRFGVPHAMVSDLGSGPYG